MTPDLDFPSNIPLGAICSPDNVNLYIYTESGWVNILDYVEIPPMPPDLQKSLANF
jgi:hypothetical protein